MIQLTRLNHVPLIINSDLIEHIEVTPDTVITLTNGQRFLVLESAAEVVEKVVSFRKTILGGSNCAVLAQQRAVDAARTAGVAETHGE